MARKSEIKDTHFLLNTFYCPEGNGGILKKEWGQIKVCGSVHFFYIWTANQI